MDVGGVEWNDDVGLERLRMIAVEMKQEEEEHLQIQEEKQKQEMQLDGDRKRDGRELGDVSARTEDEEGGEEQERGRNHRAMNDDQAQQRVRIPPTRVGSQRLSTALTSAVSARGRERERKREKENAEARKLSILSLNELEAQAAAAKESMERASRIVDAVERRNMERAEAAKTDVDRLREAHEKKMEEIAEQRYVLCAPSIHIEQRRSYFFGVG